VPHRAEWLDQRVPMTVIVTNRFHRSGKCCVRPRPCSLAAIVNTPNEDLPQQKWPPLTVAQANEISAMTDPALRNLKITQGYHDLKIALTRLFGAKNVTWCAYATWASKTAGTFIRGDEVPGLIHKYLTTSDHIAEVLAKANGSLFGVHEHASVD